VCKCAIDEDSIKMGAERDLGIAEKSIISGLLLDAMVGVSACCWAGKISWAATAAGELFLWVGAWRLGIGLPL
jgi:hypothetical protein